MKRMLLPPIFVLAALLAFSLWNIRHMEGETDRWREQLHAADRLALFGSDVDITYSVNGSRLSVGDAERLQEKAEELGVSAELILK